MPRLIWVFAGSTCQLVGFVMRWLKSAFALYVILTFKTHLFICDFLVKLSFVDSCCLFLKFCVFVCICFVLPVSVGFFFCCMKIYKIIQLLLAYCVRYIFIPYCRWSISISQKSFTTVNQLIKKSICHHMHPNQSFLSSIFIYMTAKLCVC